MVLIVVSFILIFWNEGNGLHTAQSLEQTAAAVIEVANKPIEADNNLRVVYLSGVATTNAILKDTPFAISANAIQLHRHVEMYQWQENVDTKTEKNIGGSTDTTKTYSYEKIWSDKPIDSSEFKEADTHKNPVSIKIKNQIQFATDVKVGDFKLPKDMIKKMDEHTPIDLSKTDLSALKKLYKKEVQHDGENLYFGQNPNTPEIGDMVVSISKILPGTVSIIAQQSGDTLQPYLAPAGEKISLLSMGQVSSAAMIHDAQKENMLLTWVFRLLALLMMMFGIGFLMNPLSVLADVIPFLGSLVSLGTGLLAFVGGLALWLIATACAWLTVRPMLATCLIVGAVVMVLFIIYLRKK
jgi:hypothetical protein